MVCSKIPQVLNTFFPPPFVVLKSGKLFWRLNFRSTSLGEEVSIVSEIELQLGDAERGKITFNLKGVISWSSESQLTKFDEFLMGERSP